MKGMSEYLVGEDWRQYGVQQLILENGQTGIAVHVGGLGVKIWDGE